MRHSSITTVIRINAFTSVYTVSVTIHSSQNADNSIDIYMYKITKKMKGTIPYILWPSDRLHNSTSAGSGIF